MANVRIDDFLIEQRYFEDKDEVKRYVMAGKVFVNEQKLASSAKKFKEEEIRDILVKGKKNKYVSRAGDKLEKAINYWNIDFTNKIVLDVGSSTGGFVDCSLRHGASEVYALDVGTNQLAYELRVNTQVKVFEQTNFRTIDETFFATKFDIITMDVSFISIKLLLENVNNFLKDDGVFICLIKPQFEAEKDVVREKGIIVDQYVHLEVIQSIEKACKENALLVKEVIDSPIKGTKGNKEFLAYIIKDRSL